MGKWMMERDMEEGFIPTDGATSQEATCTEKKFRMD
jgi:hypothetical protein